MRKRRNPYKQTCYGNYYYNCIPVVALYPTWEEEDKNERRIKYPNRFKRSISGHEIP